MKKIVFFGYNMEMGGAERILLNVINEIKDKCEIDLILLEKKGTLVKEIPATVNVKEIKTNIFCYGLFRFIPFIRKYIVNKIANKKYDIAVAFMEGRAATLITDLKQNCKKIAWIHNDVNLFNIGISDREIKKSYNKIDKVIMVSKHSQNSFVNKYKINPLKTEVIYNLQNEEMIIEKGKEFIPEKESFTFINVSKMRPQKRHDRLLQATAILKKEGLKFKVWLIGDGPLEEDVKKQVKDLNIEDYVVLYGLKENPYPYIKAADYFLMTSDHEGYPGVLLESLLLKTKVISTNVSGAKEILGNNKYGLIVDISLDAVVDKMREVLYNKEVSDKIDINLQKYVGSNNSIKNQLRNLFELK